jgi:PAS domain S-box-containing protein
MKPGPARDDDPAPASVEDDTGLVARLAASLPSNALLQILGSNFLVAVTDCAGQIVDVNEAVCRVSGYSRPELLGQPHGVINSAPRRIASWAELWQGISVGRAWRGEISNRAKNGAPYWEDCIIAPIFGKEGMIVKYLSISNNITAEHQTRASLALNELFLDCIGRAAGIGGWMLDLDTGLVTWSAQMNRLNDRAPDYRPTLEEGFGLYSQESKPVIQQAVSNARHHGKGWDLELRKITALGRSIWVRNVGDVEFDNGKPARLIGSMHDITARKQIEASLAKERELMTALLETLPDQIYFKDLEGRFLRVNPSLARHYGMQSVAEAIGKRDADYLTPACAQRIADVERRIVASRQPVLELEEQQQWLGRPSTWSLSTRMPLFDASNQLIGTFGVARDITLRKQREDELKEATARFAFASGSAGIGFWEYDARRDSLTWDHWMYNIHGVAPSGEIETYGFWAERLHPEDRVRCEHEFSRALCGEREFNTEYRILRPDGEVRYLKCTARTQRDDEGQPLRMTGVNIDLTDRRKVELELRETSSLLSTVLDSATEVSIVATNADLTIKMFNSGAQRLLGYSSEELVGRATPIVLHDPVEVHARGAPFGDAVQGWAVVVQPPLLNEPHEWTYVCKDGRRVTVSQVVVAMRSDQGELLGYVSVAHDVTRQKQYEESLRESTRRAEQANRAKTEFLANMSHEIRTPMNAVIGLSYLLKQTSLNEQQSKLLEKINVASKTLLALINDVLDLSKIEAGELIVEHAAFNPRELLEELADVMAVNARAKGLTFSIEIADDIPTSLEGDAKHLNQILTNLLSNAVRFTDHGGVTVRATRVDHESPGVTLNFSVLDTGIGIAAESQSKLWAPFAQADASITRRFGGTGLGLSIVKSLVTLMGGTVSLRSTPGVGSEFTVRIRFAPAAPDALVYQQVPAAEAGERGLLGVRVLVVDDSDINLDVTKRILELAGSRVWLASNGLEAFRLLQEQPFGFDVVLMDVQMPVLDGHNATRRIRAELGLIDLPIIALTAGALSSERKKAVAAGMDDFVIKPFDARMLERTILRHVKVAQSQAATPIEGAYEGRVRTATPWPQIDGIDSTLARAQLVNDLDLLHTGLQRLLHEFMDLAIPRPTGEDEVSLVEHAAIMHKLKGGAGMLGAREIQRLAGEAEAACRAGDAQRAAELVISVRQQLQALANSAQPILEAARLAAHDSELQDPTPASDSVEPHSLANLIHLLREQSLSATECFSALAPALRRQLGKEAFESLKQQIENLQFAAAADVLAKL